MPTNTGQQAFTGEYLQPTQAKGTFLSNLGVRAKQAGQVGKGTLMGTAENLEYLLDLLSGRYSNPKKQKGSKAMSHDIAARLGIGAQIPQKGTFQYDNLIWKLAEIKITNLKKYNELINLPQFRKNVPKEVLADVDKEVPGLVNLREAGGKFGSNVVGNSLKSMASEYYNHLISGIQSKILNTGYLIEDPILYQQIDELEKERDYVVGYEFSPGGDLRLAITSLIENAPAFARNLDQRTYGTLHRVFKEEYEPLMIKKAKFVPLLQQHMNELDDAYKSRRKDTPAQFIDPEDRPGRDSQLINMLQEGLVKKAYAKGPEIESKEDFFNKFQGIAQQIEAETGVPAILMLSQAALESGFGQSGLTRNDNNFFGIKGAGDAGSAHYPTKEFVNGKYVSVRSPFRRYSSPEQSFRDYARLISTSPHYRGVMEAAKTGDTEAMIQAIHQSPYATSPTYDSSLRNLIKTYGLEEKLKKPQTISQLGTARQPTRIPTPKVAGISTQRQPRQLATPIQRTSFAKQPFAKQPIVRQSIVQQQQFQPRPQPLRPQRLRLQPTRSFAEIIKSNLISTAQKPQFGNFFNKFRRAFA